MKHTTVEKVKIQLMSVRSINVHVDIITVLSLTSYSLSSATPAMFALSTPTWTVSNSTHELMHKSIRKQKYQNRYLSD